MKYTLDEKGYYRVKTLKEFYKELKGHQKFLLVTTHLFGLVQFIFCIYVYYISGVIIIESNIVTVDSFSQFVLEFIDNMLLFWGNMILPPLVAIIDIIFLKIKKFSYAVCFLNVVLIFFNYLLALAYAWQWA